MKIKNKTKQTPKSTVIILVIHSVQGDRNKQISNNWVWSILLARRIQVIQEPEEGSLTIWGMKEDLCLLEESSLMMKCLWVSYPERHSRWKVRVCISISPFCITIYILCVLIDNLSPLLINYPSLVVLTYCHFKRSMCPLDNVSSYIPIK